MTQNNSAPGLARGILYLFALHIVVIAFCFLLGFLLQSYYFLLAPLVIGLTQLLYVIPIVIWADKRRYWEFMKGIIIAAVITALLNGGCWLLFTLNV